MFPPAVFPAGEISFKPEHERDGRQKKIEIAKLTKINNSMLQSV